MHLMDKMSEVKVLFLFVILIMLWVMVTCKTIPKDNPVEPPLRVASFNIQKLGNSKLNNAKVMNIVKQVVLRYDLILLQEIVTTEETLMENLVKDINNVSSSGTYLMTISDRLGRDKAKEQYAFLYRADKLELLDAHAFPDTEDDFMRPPYVAHFSSPTLRDLTSFIGIGIHTQPKNAANETSALAKVYDYAAQHYKTKDAILMGDMNAGCSNVRIGDWENIELWTREDFTWLIGHDTDTTVSQNSCPYDRFVISGKKMEKAVIWSSIQIYDFRKAFSLSNEEALEVSDHWPIEMHLRGKVSPETERNVVARVCFSVDDIREMSLPSAVQQQKTTVGFKIYLSDDFAILENTSGNLTELLDSLTKLQTRYPQMLTRESVATILYKANHGVLQDGSSHNQLDEIFYNIDVEFFRSAKTTTIHCCATTSIN